MTFIPASKNISNVFAVLLWCFCSFCAPSTSQPEDNWCLQLNGERTCHSKDPNPYRLYGVVTSYVQQRRYSPIPKVDIQEECKPIFLNLISRHTARYPSENTLNDMRNDLPQLQKKILQADSEGKTSMCPEDIQKLKNFEWNITDHSIATFAAGIGKTNARKLGGIFKEKFPEIFNRTFDPERFYFESTDEERTIKTAKYLAEGLFGEKVAEETRVELNEPTLRFSYHCDVYQNQCQHFLTDNTEYKKFKKGRTIAALVESVSKRLGTALSHDDIIDMYDACRFGYTLQMDDVWCSVFSRDELLVLEYDEDMLYYWKDGYENDINWRNACPFAESLISQLKRAAKGDGREEALIQASHAEELKNILCMLNLHKDEPGPRSDNICSQLNRKWKTSLISPFLGNLVFALYRCKPDDKHRVLTLHNERPVIVKGCSGPFCDLDDFLKAYEPLTKDCDIKRLCCKCC